MTNRSAVVAGMLAIAFLAGALCTGEPAVADGSASWEIKLTNEAPDQLHRNDELTLGVTCTSLEPVEQVMLQVVSERVIRGDTIFIGPLGAYTGVESPNFETRTALDVQKTLALEAVPDVANTYRAELRIPLASHEFGLCEMTVSLLDANGQELAKKRLGYSVIVTLPLDQPGTIAGIDNWAATGNYGHMPTENYKHRYLINHGLGWVNLKVWWNYLYTGPGEYNEDYLKCLDEWVAGTVQQKVKIIMNPVFTPGAIHTPDDPDAVLREYRNYTEMLMKRYGDRLYAWDVFNEADCQTWIQKDGRDAKMVRIARELRDEYCPDVKIIISGQGTTTHNWVRALLKRGAGPDLDGIAWHPYRNLGPEYLEADNDVGNEQGVATFLRALEDLHNILEDGGVQGDIYINEWNYALNLQPQLDDNDNLNYMVRAMILCSTTDYVKTICVHAFGNGRLFPPASPNMTAHLMDMQYVRQCDVGDAEAYAFAFKKSDGRVIVPAWTSTTAKTVRLTGLAGPPEVCDVYGNRIDVAYDVSNKAVDLLMIAQEPIYVTAPKGSEPQLSISDVVSIDAPQDTPTSTSMSVNVNVSSLPASEATLAMRVPGQWQVSPAEIAVRGPGSHTFSVTVPADAQPKAYPILVDLRDPDDKTLALVGTMAQVTLATSAYQEQYNIVFESEFATRKLVGWQIQKSAEGTVEVVEKDGASAVLFAKIGFDFPFVIEHTIEATQYGSLDFQFKSLHDGQEFRATAGPVRLWFNPKGEILLGATRIGSYTVGEWQNMRLFFSAPDGWCRVWQNQQLLGQFPVPTDEHVAFLRFLSKQSRAGSGTDALLRAVRVTRIDPEPYESGKPLSWSSCGPFPNRIDPQTGKRPFEIDKDWLAPIGGKVNAMPCPGMAVPDGKGNTRKFLPFVGTSETDNYLYDYMVIEGLLPPEGRGDVTCYSVTYVLSDKDQEVTIGIGSDDSHALWLNHEEISRINAWPLGQGTGGAGGPWLPVKLRKGLNTILIEVDQGDGAFRFGAVLK